MARLIGGPFDGDTGDCEDLPDALYAMLCPRCGNHINWYFERPPGSERYTLHEQDTDTGRASYIYADLADPSSLRRAERELTPA